MSADLQPGVSVRIARGVRRLIAPNPGMMTGPGTNTYLVGDREVAVIDPGPALDVHVDAIIAAAGGTIRWILVTHTHRDHSPAARMLAAATGAELIGRAAPAGPHQDGTFLPDREPGDGEALAVGECRLSALHTPGHASNHLCYLLEGDGLLFTGDHIMSGSTVVIDPPDGNMRQYLESLRRLRNEAVSAILPGHGDVLDQPHAVIEWIVDHRLQREAKVVEKLARHPDTSLSELVTHVYDDVDSRLHRIAERSLLAHLLKLEEEGRARRASEHWRVT